MELAKDGAIYCEAGARCAVGRGPDGSCDRSDGGGGAETEGLLIVQEGEL